MAKEKKDDLDVLFDSITKINPFSTTLDDEKGLAHVSGYLSTRYYAVNAILSGDIYKGIPHGRATTIFGPSASGKSLISALLQKSAQENDMRVIIFDTEFDKDGRMEASFGVDLSKVKTVPIETAEELIIQSNKIIEQIVGNPKLHGKVLFVLDSIGFIGSDKEMKDAVDKNKVAMDMGLKAKQLKTWARTFKGKLSKSKCPMLMINHEIANPNQMYESIFKEQGGGKWIEFLSTVMVHISSRNEKQDENNLADEISGLTKGNYTGKTLKLFTQKNRLIQPFKTADVYLNFVTGPAIYSGLLELVQGLDVKEIYLKDAEGNVGKGRTYYLRLGEEEVKLGAKKDWLYDKEIWDKILPILNEYVKNELNYKTHVV